MNVLVTGGAGFIGSNFIHYWMKQHPEDSIINLDALTYAGNLENLVAYKDTPRYTFVRGDIADRDTVFPLVESVDIIVHFAAETHVDRSILDPGIFLRTNVMGTQVLLDAAKKYKKRFHHVSTDEVFGALGPQDPPFDETTPYDPRSPYSAAKAASDHLVRAYHHTYGVETTISNCSNNYGPYMFPEKLIPLFICNLLEGKKVPVYGDGLQVRDWIHVTDHVRGIDAIIQKGRIGETYCLGGNAEMTNMQLTKTLLSLLHKDESSIEFVQDRPGHDRRYAINFSKATQELGWQPQMSFEEGLKDMVAWYLANQEWVARCKSGEYQSYYDTWYHNTLSMKQDS
ncbi:MAG: dTDP-glucose 4,6-dehydratase [Candidatus Magasanikbacteria bacterium]|nr:dTDP-glucose 4,6-dehydratase [Candidatus Magasanikbacteria bacterium]